MTDVDVLILGSGAAGLTAALAAHDAGASVAVLEKAAVLGGTTGLSSGVVWLPVHPLRSDTSGPSARADARRYLDSLSLGMTRPEMLEAYLDGCVDLVDWLHGSTPVRLLPVDGFPDYHPENPGGRPLGGRSLEPALFSLDDLGPWAARLTGRPRRMAVAETPSGGGTGFLSPAIEAERRERGVEGLGRALVAALLQGCLDRGIVPELEARASRLLTEGDRVVGVDVETPNGARAVSVSHGVVLATGGFDHDPDFVTAFLRGPMRRPTGVVTNTGDGLRMAMRVGAALGNMREAWWVPVAETPDADVYGGNGLHLVLRERTLPRSIIVNGAGHRFTNEAANYNALGGAFHRLDPVRFAYENQPCWLVFDEGFVRRYGGFGVPAGSPMPSWVRRAPDLSALADAVGVPGAELVATVGRWNELVALGEDTDFHRGRSVYDRWCGDRSLGAGPETTLGPLDEGPYYAVELISSALGTSGGPLTTTTGAVVDVDGKVIRGLYAAGNAMAAPTGMAYGGAGGTLGPAMVFGFLAGRAVGGSPADS